MGAAAHALIALTGLIQTTQFLCATQTKGWLLRFMDREPIVFFSCFLGGIALSYVSVLY